MLILALESSCDETAAAIVKDGRTVLSSVIASSAEMHAIYGGVVPEIASRKHVEAIVPLVDEAMKRANVTHADLDAVAVTYAPGLIGAVLVGVNFAKSVAYALNLPLIPVHHVRGHIAANYLTHPDLEPPYLCLVASGGHSHIVKVNSYTELETVGKTTDDAAGEAFDKAARAMGFPYPGGVHIDKAAKLGDSTKYKLPKPATKNEYDFSFSGLKTAVMNLINNSRQKGEEVDMNSVAACFQETITDILSVKFILAAENLSYKKIALAGGVAANSALRGKIAQKAEANGMEFFVPELSLCGDNAAMIGCQAYYEYLAGNIADMSLNAYATKKLHML